MLSALHALAPLCPDYVRCPVTQYFVLCWVLYGFTAQELTDALFERSRTLVNCCDSKYGLDDRFVRIACHTEEENDWLVAILKQMAPEPTKQEPALIR